jgi:hypothetical protein
MATELSNSSLIELLHAAYHALRSYEYGNGSPELAKAAADRIERALKELNHAPRF